jgi:hypothetical protein
MRLAVLTVMFAAYALGTSAVLAQGCHHTCAEGYTYSTESKSCVKKTVSS